MPEIVESPSRQLRYDMSIENVDETSHYGRVAHLVGHSKKVLELGCNTGYISQVLGQQFGCQVWGLEIDEQAAEQARSRCQDVICADLDHFDLTTAYAGHKFDVVLCGDVIEHLRTPEKTLKQIHQVLAPGGRIIISIPNATHGSVRLALLSGHFPYRPMGLLDDTHLRFFNRATLELALNDCGFEVLSVGRNRWHSLDSEIGRHLSMYPQPVLDGIYRDPEVETFQFLIEARVKPEAAQVREPATLPFVDVLVFEEPGLPIDDRFRQYLNALDYPRERVTFHWVKDGALAGSTNKPDGTPIPFGDNDFRRFRFAKPQAQELVATPEQNPTHTPFSKAALVRWLSNQLQGDLMFTMSTHSYPGVQCLTKLVEAMVANPNCAIVSATPELTVAPLPLTEAQNKTAAAATDYSLTSWVALDCALLRREAIAAISEPIRAVPMNLQTAGKINTAGMAALQPGKPALPPPFDVISLSWDAWLSGKSVMRIPQASFFYCGVPAWTQSWSSSWAVAEHATSMSAAPIAAGGANWPHPVLHSELMSKYGTTYEIQNYAMRLSRRLLRKPHIDLVIGLVNCAGAFFDRQGQKKRQSAPASARRWVKFSGPLCTTYGPLCHDD